MGKLISITEAAEKLGVSRQRVHQLIQADVLPAFKVGRTWAIDEDDVKNIDDYRNPPGRPPKDPRKTS